ncbi:MAG: hypothetical protein HUJ76_03195 [Parasporobacterium sp.]|nr:hypothetical protein [Parasporobacterium sp.]
MFLMDDVNKWKAVYRLLDRVSTEPFDCGTLCGSACCCCRNSTSEMGIYLYPGEHLIFDDPDIPSDWLDKSLEDPGETGFPESWTEPVYFVKCNTPPVCPRKWRPLQCRTFPLKPVISDTGVLELIWNDDELPYKCPIIEDNMPIHDDFYRATYTVWSHLLRDRRIFDLVMMWSE